MLSLRILSPRSIAAAGMLVLALDAAPVDTPLTASSVPQKFPYPEKLVYRVGWRMVTAGEATLRLTPTPSHNWQFNLDLASLGFVNQLYKVLDSYKLSVNEKFCGSSVDFDAQEGKHRSKTTILFDNTQHKLITTNKDLVANSSKTVELAIPPCTYDIAGALMTLRASQLEPGMKFSLPVTDGKRLANVKVEGLSKDKLNIKGVNYNTIRYETFVFDNVLYRRKGRLLMWITDDAQRLPVQMRFVFGFPLGDVTLELQKVEPL